MDTVTASKERLEFVKVCIEFPASSIIPKQIEVQMRDDKVALIRVTVPWMPKSCTKCESYGDGDKKSDAQPKKVWKLKEKVTETGESSTSADTLHLQSEITEEAVKTNGQTIDDHGLTTAAKDSVQNVEAVEKQTGDSSGLFENAGIENDDIEYKVVEFGIETIAAADIEKDKTEQKNVNENVSGDSAAIKDSNDQEFHPLQNSGQNFAPKEESKRETTQS